MKNTILRNLGKSLFETLGILLFLSVLSFGCKKSGGAGGGPDPTPTPSGTPQGTPTPTGTPRYVPTPEPADPDCITHTDLTPVKPRISSCPSGYEKRTIGVNLPVGHERRTDVCVAKSVCKNATRENSHCWFGDYPEIQEPCHPFGEVLEYSGRDGCNDGHGPKPCDQAMAYGYMTDVDRGHQDALGRVYWVGAAPAPNRLRRGWEFYGICAPKLCPEAPIGTICSEDPIPPKLSRFDLSIVETWPGGEKVVDVTPIVCDGAPGSPFENYCARSGQTGPCCPVKRGDDPMRSACENEVVGTERSNMVEGPWVTSPTNMHVYKHGDNPYAVVTNPGNQQHVLRVCTNRAPVVCSEIQVGP